MSKMSNTEVTRNTYDTRYVLIRPELFVAWAGDTLGTKPNGILARALGS
jgi:hypothetical protein